jgi:multicomponent Na+:H+ antiporter subunit E
MTGGAVRRGAIFFVLWLAISGFDASDIVVALVVSAAATRASLIIVEPRAARLRPAAALMLAVNFLQGSLVAGFDVARRAMRPKLDLRPGFVRSPLRLGPGDARNAFCAIASLLPGTLPTGDDGDAIIVHGLDTSQPIASDLAREEGLFMRTFRQ